MDGQVLWSEEGTTRGDPLAMPTYALATIPLIDDHSGIVCGRCLRCWLSTFHPCLVGSHRILRSRLWIPRKCLQDVARCEGAIPVQGLGAVQVNITSCGRPYLGAPLGSDEEFVTKKVQEWSEQLLDVAITQPHVTFTTFVHGYTGADPGN